MTYLSNPKYFFMNESCILVKGSMNGALYDLKNGDVFSINHNEALILELCEKGEKLENIHEILKITASDVDMFVKEVHSSGLGNFYERRVYMDKHEQFNRIEMIPKPIKLKTLIVELHRKCHLNCLFCKKNGAGNYIYCGCRREENSPVLSLTTIKSAIKEAIKFNLDSVYIVGGDPFWDKQELLNLLYFCRENALNITIHTNGTNIDDYCIDVLNEVESHLEIPVYSHVDKIHDHMVNEANTFKKLLAVLNKLLNKGVNPSIILYTSIYNLGDPIKAFEFFRNIGCQTLRQRFIFPEELSNAHTPFLESYNHAKMNFPKTSRNQFLLNKKANNCLNGKLAITAEGNITPCHMAQKEVLGNIRKTGLSEVLRQGRMDIYWESSKDKFHLCRQCEFRYLCVDCPIIEHRVENRNFDKNIYCRYNPIVGKLEV